MEFPWLNPEIKVEHLLSDFKGHLYPFQRAGVAFLASVRKCLLLDQPGLGKTIQALAAFNLIKTQKPSNLKIVIVTLASTQIQWVREAAKFFPGLRLEAVIGKPANREATYARFKADKLDGIVIHYHQLINDINLLNPEAYFNLKCEGPIVDAIDNKPFWLVLDEIQSVKNVTAKRSKVALWLSERALGVKGLTATPVYNHLIDIYGIFKIIEPAVFKNKQTFKKDFCVMSFAFSPYGQITGYKNHDKLKQRIKNFTLGRTKQEVASDLPPLVTKNYYVELPQFHRSIYDDVEEGFSFETNYKSIEMIGALQRAQVCVNAVEALDDYRGKPSHPKLDETVRLLQEEFEGQKVVIFSKFEKTVSILSDMLAEEAIPHRRITGKEDQLSRDKAVQDFNSKDVDVMLITTAGGAGLNLQAGGALIFIDRPWSMGELTQIRGRIHRIGSKHETLVEAHLVVEGTIDEHVIELLGLKEQNAEQVFGEIDKPISPNELWRRIHGAKHHGKGAEQADKLSAMQG